MSTSTDFLVRLGDFTTCPRVHLISPIRATLTRTLQRYISRLPAVDPVAPTQVLGYLGRASILSARLRLHHEETFHPKG